MSTEMIKLEWEHDGSYVEIEKVSIRGERGFNITVFHPSYGDKEPVPTLIDCGQAKELMQFLQENLK